jgi:hypothetical protein
MIANWPPLLRSTADVRVRRWRSDSVRRQQGEIGATPGTECSSERIRGLYEKSTNWRENSDRGVG